MTSTRLPYDFDLHWDVKTMEDVERIANGEGHCSDADGNDLVDLFILHDMEIPECLTENNYFGTEVIHIFPNGVWRRPAWDGEAVVEGVRRVTINRIK